MAWQLQEAKQRFSEVVNRALGEGPQVVTRHGREVVVILAADEFHRLADDRQDFKEFLMAGPDLAELDVARSGTTRRVEL